MSEQIRVLVVDDDALVRAGLSMLLAGAEDIEIVGEAADGSQVAQAAAEHRRLFEHARQRCGGARLGAAGPTEPRMSMPNSA